MEISDNVNVAINPQKIAEDQKWDGLEGYLNNTSLPAKEVYEQYWIRLQTSNTTLTKTMLLTSKQKSIALLFDEIFWENF